MTKIQSILEITAVSVFDFAGIKKTSFDFYGQKNRAENSSFHLTFSMVS